MPDDVGGRPFPDGDEPEDHGHGAADEEFATVVFDEDFIRSARIHEPTAVERMLAAAQARAEAEASRAHPAGPGDDELYGPGYGPDLDGLRAGAGEAADDDHDPYGPYGGSLRPYRRRARWYRPVAWALALIMGVGMVALAFAAVYRGAAGGRQAPSPPPATTGVDAPRVEQSAGELTVRPTVLPPAPPGGTEPRASAAPRAG